MSGAWGTAIVWALALWCLVAAIVSTGLTMRTRRATRRLRALWLDQAPPCPPIQVLLRTGETITVQPVDVQQTWTWFAPVPDPSLVDEVTIPDLPPWTSVVPVPDTWPRRDL